MKKLLFLFLFVMIPTQAFAFSDIETNTHKESIVQMTELRFMTGYEDDTFRPNEPITRGEAIVALYQFFYALDEQNYQAWRYSQPNYIDYTYAWNEDYFSDVAADSGIYYSSALFKQLQIISGYADGTFRANSYLTRSQFAEILQKTTLLPNQRVLTPFKDIYSAETEAISNLYAYSIVKGTSATTYSPNKKVTRGQFATLLDRTYTFIKQAAPAHFRVVKTNKEQFSDTVTDSQFIPITAENAAQYDLTAEQLKAQQYIAFQFIAPTGCAEFLQNVTLTESVLTLHFGQTSVERLGVYACTTAITVETKVIELPLDWSFTTVEVVKTND